MRIEHSVITLAAGDIQGKKSGPGGPTGAEAAAHTTPRVPSHFPQISLPFSLCLAPPSGRWAVVTGSVGAGKGQKEKGPQPGCSSPQTWGKLGQGLNCLAALLSSCFSQLCAVIWGKRNTQILRGVTFLRALTASCPNPHFSTASYPNPHISSVLHHNIPHQIVSSLREGPFLNYLFTSSTCYTVGTQKNCHCMGE